MEQQVYIAGPMRGIPEFNFPAFDAARDELSVGGYIIVSPADHDRESGFDPTGMTGNEDLAGLGFDLRSALAWDLQQVAESWGIMLLPGWEKSSGVRAELATAAALGLQATEYLPEGELAWGHWRPAKEYIEQPINSSVAKDGEVRTVDPNTGAQKGSKEVRMDLIPIFPLSELARLYGRGAQKYADRNWEKGFDWSLSYAALMRHVTQWWGGEDNDPEMGTSHLASVAWHAFALLEFTKTHPAGDNRPTTTKEDYDE